MKGRRSSFEMFAEQRAAMPTAREQLCEEGEPSRARGELPVIVRGTITRPGFFLLSERKKKREKKDGVAGVGVWFNKEEEEALWVRTKLPSLDRWI